MALLGNCALNLIHRGAHARLYIVTPPGDLEHWQILLAYPSIHSDDFKCKSEHATLQVKSQK